MILNGLIAASGSVLCQTSAQPSNALVPSSSGQTASAQTASALSSDPSLEGLANRLNLSQAQLKLWDDFAFRVHAWEQNLYKEHPVWSADANVVAEMSRLTLNQQNRLSLLEDMESSLKALYATLNAQQQQVMNTSLLQAIPGLLPNLRNENSDSGSRRDSGRFGSGGSGRRRTGAMGAMN